VTGTPGRPSRGVEDDVPGCCSPKHQPVERPPSAPPFSRPQRAGLANRSSAGLDTPGRRVARRATSLHPLGSWLLRPCSAVAGTAGRRLRGTVLHLGRALRGVLSAPAGSRVGQTALATQRRVRAFWHREREVVAVRINSHRRRATRCEARMVEQPYSWAVRASGRSLGRPRFGASTLEGRRAGQGHREAVATPALSNLSLPLAVWQADAGNEGRWR
jgi:hypothetical protein